MYDAAVELLLSGIKHQIAAFYRTCIQKRSHKCLIPLEAALLILLVPIQKFQLHSQFQHSGIIKMMHYATGLQSVINTGLWRPVENGLLAVPCSQQRLEFELCLEMLLIDEKGLCFNTLPILQCIHMSNGNNLHSCYWSCVFFCILIKLKTNLTDCAQNKINN